MKSASSTIEEVVARQFVERLARERNLPLPNRAAFTDTAPAAKGKRAKAEPPKPAPPTLPPPRLIKSAKANKPHPEAVEARGRGGRSAGAGRGARRRDPSRPRRRPPQRPSRRRSRSSRHRPPRRRPRRLRPRRAGRSRRGVGARAGRGGRTAGRGAQPRRRPRRLPRRCRRCRSRPAAWCRRRCGCASKIPKARKPHAPLTPRSAPRASAGGGGAPARPDRAAAGVPLERASGHDEPAGARAARRPAPAAVAARPAGNRTPGAELPPAAAPVVRTTPRTGRRGRRCRPSRRRHRRSPALSRSLKA